jgi:hypothetical protein
MLRTAALLLGLAALTLLTAANAGTSATGLHGMVTLSPTRPVCIESQPCSKPAAGVMLRFSQYGRVVGQATTAINGTYRIALRRGSYAVSFRPQSPTRTIAPDRVRVVSGRMTRTDFEIDTGIR